jgi:TolB-like protein
VKSARRAVGDDGKEQGVVRTIHGRGFRFVAEVTEAASPRVHDTAPLAAASPAPPAGTRPSIAVLPFRLVGEAGPWAAIADALPDELIAALSRLRWLFVIARGSSFRFRSAAPDLAEVGKALGARYCLSGMVEVSAPNLVVTVQLADTGDGGVVWADRFTSRVDFVHEIRDTIAARVVAALEMRIPEHEAGLAKLSSPGSLDAWAAYHLGLAHMFRFNRHDNEVAGGLFARAVALAPDFARAHAGRSFVHFQNSFLAYTADPAVEAAAARRAAEKAVELDPLDPFANTTMGRSFWLGGDLDSSLAWLERAASICPNHAHGVYARAWTETLLGRGADGRRDADLAMALSPLDPLYYAMAATRSLAHLVSGEDADAARWARTAARSPGAHVLIAAIATAALAIGGDREGAAAWAANVRERRPSITRDEFFRAFPFVAGSTRDRIAGALAESGI